jgi:hypothetical protein
MTTSTPPRGGEEEIEEVSEALVAYVVHLIWADARRWDTRRRLGREEALALADRLAGRLSADVRTRLEVLRSRGVS